MSTWQRNTLPDCPEWCVRRHEVRADGGLVHVGGALLVRDTVLHLCPVRRAGHEEPYVRVGEQEYSLHEAEALLGALTQLVDTGRASLLAQQA